MTSINVGTVDVYLIAPDSAGWEVLTLQRAQHTRCPTAWETVHGHIEPGESPSPLRPPHSAMLRRRASAGGARVPAP